MENSVIIGIAGGQRQRKDDNHEADNRAIPE